MGDHLVAADHELRMSAARAVLARVQQIRSDAAAVRPEVRRLASELSGIRERNHLRDWVLTALANPDTP